MRVKVYTLNSFAKITNGGNPAGVVLDSEELSEGDMQKIAASLNYSETAFVQKSQKADYKLRFFTPNREVDLCGHATVAAFFLMASKGMIGFGDYTQETKAGILNVENRKDNKIFMDQTLPKFYEIIEKREIAQSLNISEDIIMSNLPVQVVSTGLKDIFIPISSLKELELIRPDLDKVAEVSRKYGATGYHLFTLETKYASTVNCRNFAPLYDIPEEAATGTSSGALSCYLFKNGIVTEKAAENLIFEQGYSMGRPSEIRASLSIKNGEIIRVKVGGSASDIKEKKIETV